MDESVEKYFGYTDGITTNNFIAGIQLFRMAYEKGMIRVIDIGKSFEYEARGKEILEIQGNFNNIKKN